MNWIIFTEGDCQENNRGFYGKFVANKIFDQFFKKNT
jgi:hypothetical protein